MLQIYKQVELFHKLQIPISCYSRQTRKIKSLFKLKDKNNYQSQVLYHGLYFSVLASFKKRQGAHPPVLQEPKSQFPQELLRRLSWNAKP